MKTNLRIFLLAMLVMTLATTTTHAWARPMNDDLGEKVDAYITETMKRFPIPGMAVGIVKGDKVLYLKGYGTANADGDPVTPQTPFMLASVTKTFTALAVQQLAQAGKIDLNAPVQTYIPDFRLNDEHNGATVTVRHLLDHTSGISTIEGTQPSLHSSRATFDSALKQLARYRPDYEPGELYEYSNWNYALLGEVISRTSGQTYVEYMQDNILNPLEMSRASFADYHTLPGVATGNLIVFGIPVPYNEKVAPATRSAGYLSASAEDMTHYLLTYYNHGQYNRHALLNSEGLGWYDAYWNWHTGMPDDISIGFSGGHNSINTNIQLFPFHRVGVVILMNTRLEQLIPGPSANEIAFNLARMSIDYPYEVPSNRVFYGGYAALDLLLVILIVSILWQILRWKGWSIQYRNAQTKKRIILWLGIVLDILLSIGIFILPSVLKTRWNIILFFRPDFSVPLLLIGICLGILGISKIIRSKYKLDNSENSSGQHGKVFISPNL
ncbi:MAG: serine hydrolase domain-containing protein [Anaerolineales bacterium]